MTPKVIAQCVENWKQRGMAYAVHYRHSTDPTLQFIDGYDEESLVPEKRKWKRRGYQAKHVYIFQMNR